MDRRDFLRGAGAAALASIMPFPAFGQAASPRARTAHSFYVDAQGAIDGFEPRPGGGFGPTQAFRDAVRNRRIDIISGTIGEVGNGPNRFQSAVEAIAQFNRLIGDYPDLLMKIERAADMEAARAAGRVGFIYNFQDTTALEADADKVDIFKALGIRMIQLTYNRRNIAGDGCLETSNAGISSFGREVIAKINQARLVLDLSHAGQRTIAEGIAASTAPPAITHSGCKAINDNPRNVADAEMRALAQKGGMFGLYLMPFLAEAGRQPGREDLLRHLDHAVTICGEDHVGIGTDNPLMGYMINDETRASHRRITEDRMRRGVAAPGESPDVLLYVDGYNGVDRYDRLAMDLSRRGWRQARIDKVLGGNWVRYFGEVWG